MRGTCLATSLLILFGCASTPPTVNPWPETLPVTPEVVRPADLPSLPQATIQGDLATFDAQGMRMLSAYRIVAEGNTEIGRANADQVQELWRAAEALHRAGSAEHDIAELRQVLLESERRGHLWGRVTDWILIAILAVAASR